MTIQPSVSTDIATCMSLPTIGSVPESAVPYALAESLKSGKPIIMIAGDDKRAAEIAACMPFFSPDAEVLLFPSWDVLPYDWTSPNPTIVTERLETLAALASPAVKPRLVITTVAAWMQKLPPKDILSPEMWRVEKGTIIQRDAATKWLIEHGYRHMPKAVESGEFAFRGDILDVVPAGSESGCRIDCFGDEVEQIRQYDPLTQKSAQSVERITLLPASEVLLTGEHIEHFRRNYREVFGAVSREDALYEAISSGQRASGMEHWLPCFYTHIVSLLDYAGEARIFVDEAAVPVFAHRQELIEEYYQARLSPEYRKYADQPRHPLPPESLYLLGETLQRILEQGHAKQFTAFAPANAKPVFAFARGIVSTSQDSRPSPWSMLEELQKQCQREAKALLLACASIGSRERLSEMLRQHGLEAVRVERIADVTRISGAVQLAVLPLLQGFSTPDMLVLSEQDLLGERLIRTQKKKRPAELFLQEAASFTEGELVVHREHGIGRFEKLETLEVNAIRHDCLKLTYADGDRLFVPVENIDVLSRYGSEEEAVLLDKLGASHWQARKARMKERITLAAAELMKTAAERQLKPGVILHADSEDYTLFVSRFGHAETEDQERSIEEVLADLQSGRPMDRLVCGDVGFGKTEVALRAAYVAVKSNTCAIPPVYGGVGGRQFYL